MTPRDFGESCVPAKLSTQESLFGMADATTFDSEKVPAGVFFVFFNPSSASQAVASALEAARSRRQRLQDAVGSTPQTPSVRAGVKRDLPKKPEPASASTTASLGVPSEKVTPDPKHAKVHGLPSPRALFAEHAEATEGGFRR